MKWQDPWFRKLQPKGKLLWSYMVDNCDNAGVWKIDTELASFCIGESISMDDIKHLNDDQKERVVLFNADSLVLIKDFIDFQIMKINSVDDKSKLTNLQKNCIITVLKYLESGDLQEKDFGIITGKLPVLYSIVTGVGIGKGNSKGNSEDSESGGGDDATDESRKPYGEFSHVKLSDTEYAKLLALHGQNNLDNGIELLDDYIESKGKRYKSHYAVLKEGSWVWERLKQLGYHSKHRRVTVYEGPDTTTNN